MRINSILIVLILLTHAGCKGNSAQNITGKIENARQSMVDQSVSSSQGHQGKETDDTPMSFVVSCGSGCSMRYTAENIIYNQSYIEVKFKIETFTDGILSDTYDETDDFYYDAAHEISAVCQKGSTTNILEDLPSDALSSLKAFGKRIYHQKAPATMTKKGLLVKSNEELPYHKRIDIKTVKYHLIDSKLLKGADEFLCGGGDRLRYVPLPSKNDISLILVPMDCGDFDDRFYLLTIKNQVVVSNLYVEGIWYEPDSEGSEETTSFEIDKDFSIKVKTTSSGSPTKVQYYAIKPNGQIAQKTR